MNNERVINTVRWTARILSVAVILFWGGFFIEHAKEWFIDPLPQVPPPKVWFAQLLHFLILAGLVIGWKWERAGGILVVVASVLFFADKAPLFILPTIVPGILYLFCWWQERRLLAGVKPVTS